ncbi:MAG: RDD family protein [Ureaplasma sp.]|nr:RDD family protein [Ureaplasma sp.]
MEKQEYKEYNYSSVWKRFIARILDFLFISIFTISFSLLFFINSDFKISDIFKANNDNLAVFEGWRVFCITLCTFIINFFYFCIIPLLTKGLTLFKYVFKIRVWTLERIHSLFFKIFKRELLIWMLFYSFSIVSGIIIWASNDTNKMIQAILSIDNDVNNSFFAWGIFIKIMYAICGIINLVLIVYMLFNNHKLSLQDIISSTFVYDYKKPIDEKVIVTSFKVIQESKKEDFEDKSFSLPSLPLIDKENKKWEKLQNSTIFNELSIRQEKAKKLNFKKENNNE